MNIVLYPQKHKKKKPLYWLKAKIKLQKEYSLDQISRRNENSSFLLLYRVYAGIIFSKDLKACLGLM